MATDVTVSRSLPYVRLLGAQLAIGGAAIFARYAMHAGGAATMVSAFRLGIAAAVVLAFTRGFGRLSWRRELAFALAGLALAIHFVTWFASLLLTSVAISTLLVTTTPIWTETFDCIRERRTPNRAFIVALAGGLAGIAVIVFSPHHVQPGHAGVQIPGHAGDGARLALIGSLAIGAYLLIVRDAGGGASGRLETGAIVSRTYTWAALAMIAVSIFLHTPPPPLADTEAWGGILAMALVSQLLGHTALNAALRDFTPSVIALSTLLEAPIAALFAALIFKETVSLTAALGGALVIGSVGLVLRNTPSANALGGGVAAE